MTVRRHPELDGGIYFYALADAVGNRGRGQGEGDATNVS